MFFILFRALALSALLFSFFNLPAFASRSGVLPEEGSVQEASIELTRFSATNEAELKDVSRAIEADYLETKREHPEVQPLVVVQGVQESQELEHAKSLAQRNHWAMVVTKGLLGAGGTFWALMIQSPDVSALAALPAAAAAGTFSGLVLHKYDNFKKYVSLLPGRFGELFMWWTVEFSAFNLLILKTATNAFGLTHDTLGEAIWEAFVGSVAATATQGVSDISIIDEEKYKLDRAESETHKLKIKSAAKFKLLVVSAASIFLTTAALQEKPFAAIGFTMLGSWGISKLAVTYFKRNGCGDLLAGVNRIIRRAKR